VCELTSPKKPRWIHIVGRKNSGKTTMIEILVDRLTSDGYRVGTVKHSGHRHPVDQPGKDSWRHRRAGAAVTALLSGGQAGLFFDLDSHQSYKQQLAERFHAMDLVLVEGDKESREGLIIEVWRSPTNQPPLAAVCDTIIALITDDPLPEELNLPILSFSDINAIVNLITSEIYE